VKILLIFLVFSENLNFMQIDTAVACICHDIFNFIKSWLWPGCVAKHENSIRYITFLTFLEPMMSHGTKMTYDVSDAFLHSVSIWVLFLS
jgi:hypothetical protein